MNKEIKITAYIDWFTTVDDVDEISELPEIFETLSSSKEQALDELSSASKFLKCRFVSDNFLGWEEFIDCSTDGEFESDKTILVGLDFKGGNVPYAKAEGVVSIKLKEGVSVEEFENWIEETGALLSDGVIFYWDFSSIESLEDLDFSQEEHLGLEAVITN